MWNNVSKVPKKHVLTDVDRRISADTRKIQGEIRQAERRIELIDLEERLNELKEKQNPTDVGDNMEDKLIMKVFENLQQAPPQQEVKRQVLSDEQIQDVLKSIPKNHIKMAKSMPHDIVIQKIQELAPVDTDTAERVYKAIQ